MLSHSLAGDMALYPTCVSEILMVLSHFVALFPILRNATRSWRRKTVGPDCQLSFCWERKDCLRSSLCLLKHTRTIVFMCRRVWQGQTEGGLWGVGGCTVKRMGGWVELAGGNPREEIREQYKSSFNTGLFLCRLGQSTSSVQQQAAKCRGRAENPAGHSERVNPTQCYRRNKQKLKVQVKSNILWLCACSRRNAYLWRRMTSVCLLESSKNGLHPQMRTLLSTTLWTRPRYSDKTWMCSHYFSLKW